MKKLSKTQIAFLTALENGIDIRMSPPCHMNITTGYRWQTFMGLNRRGLVWARPFTNLSGLPAEVRPQHNPGELYYGGDGCFDQKVFITDVGKKAIGQ